jgi:hypothetical protein
MLVSVVRRLGQQRDVALRDDTNRQRYPFILRRSSTASPVRAISLPWSMKPKPSRADTESDGRPETHRYRLQPWQPFVEQLWSRAVAAQRNPPQMLSPESAKASQKPLALGFAPPPEHLDGKEGVDGSSRSEGSQKASKWLFLLS